MKTICAYCQALISQVSPLEDGIVSHGACHICALRLLKRGGLATPEEMRELAAIEAAAEPTVISVQVPATVAAALAVDAAAAREPFAVVAGRVLVAALNRREHDDYEPAIYIHSTHPLMRLWDVNRVLLQSEHAEIVVRDAARAPGQYTARLRYAGVAATIRCTVENPS